MLGLRSRASYRLSSTAMAAVALLSPLSWTPLAAQRPAGAAAGTRIEIGPVATCCRPSMELYERYQRTPPAERPPEVAFYHAQGFAGPLYAVVRDSAMWSWLWRGLNRGIMRV